MESLFNNFKVIVKNGDLQLPLAHAVPVNDKTAVLV